MERKQRVQSLGYYMAFGTLVLFLVAVAVVWWQLSHASDFKSEVSGNPSPSKDIAAPVNTSRSATETSSVGDGSELMSQDDELLEFTPDQVILNVECRMLAGKGAARDVAVVTMPTAGGAEFVVLDNAGIRTRGQLDFWPNHTRIGRRSDGSVVFGFGALRRNSGVFRPPDSDEPVRIYHDDHVVYETNKAWDFDVAPDGTTFFLHQPSPGGHSRLVVNNIVRGTQVEHELGSKLTPVSAFSSEHAAQYSKEGSEIVFIPSHADAMGRGIYYFYPVGEGRTRRITVEGHWAALLTSSETGYFVDWPEDLSAEESGDVWQVTKRRLGPSSDEIVDLWSRRIRVEWFGGLLSLSQNGRWLGFSGWDYKVLDTATGDTVFSFPYAGNPAAKLARLAPVLPEGTTEEEMGRHGSMKFDGNHLVAYRIRGDASACGREPGEPWDPIKWRECLKEQRLNGTYQEFFDVWDMSTIEPESSPTVATQVYSESNCMPANPPWRGLIEVDGQLAFRASQTIEPNSQR